ncbi:hypothetical protein COY87_03555 [Candidatus Roizmanbacteria bacterium CG_4_10_14_0_8_um_filter_33_9]|uniref:Transport permease protein n=1 Tax=Candidatus Roizmanbacteria bacterium CG_4_10_14_0_8_um_filter_33_9 TaxID=1974826 RepID=A0A2M7QI12_9BACT|nr:MAG: hypothetical protein COY87_03555 [Candidatus Roizmanbacteria bacterium CG_4_10_14_0_8_um_filter_33_9]
MKAHRIKGIVLRYMFIMKHSLNRWSDMIYWPILDLLIWGLTIKYMTALSLNPQKMIISFIAGMLLWTFVWRGQYEISVSILEDLWSRNLINLFVSPLTFWEFISAFIIIGILKAGIGFIIASSVAFLLYKVNMFALGFYLVPFALLLFMTGWWVGFFVGGLILRYGTKVEQFAWSMVYLVSPFSAIYYPLSILPNWAQTVAKLIPTSYIFEGAREVITKGILDPKKILYCFILNCIYMALAIFFMRKSFNKILQKGLVKVY